MPETPATPPGHRRVTVAPQLPNQGFRPMLGTDPPKYVPFTATITAANESTFRADFDVESWIVSVLPDAAVRATVATGESAVGPSIRLGGGGNVRIPGDGPSLSIRNTSANTLQVTVIALVGYYWMFYNGGDIT